MNHLEYGIFFTLGFLGTAWLFWLEYHLRVIQAQLRKIQNDKQDLIIRNEVSGLSDVDLNNKLSNVLTGPDPTKPTT